MFVHLKIGKEPRRVTMQSLLVTDPSVEGSLRPNRSLLPPNSSGTESDEEAPGHYRSGQVRSGQVRGQAHRMTLCLRLLPPWRAVMLFSPFCDGIRWSVLFVV